MRNSSSVSLNDPTALGSILPLTLSGSTIALGVIGSCGEFVMQQTFSVSNDEIVRITGGVPQGAFIPQDGKVCAPNGWPYP